MLRTCFRIGEALNAGCSRPAGATVAGGRYDENRSSGSQVIIELYARVKASWREDSAPRSRRAQQHFVLHDLYHDKPPRLQGVYDRWDQSELWEMDSRPFLAAAEHREGMMARVLGCMKRDGREWRLEIWSVWQADWEDVLHVAGIYCI